MIDQKSLDDTKRRTIDERREVVDKRTVINMNLPSRIETKSIQLLNSFGSRGSVMLKAALNEQKRQTNHTANNQVDGCNNHQQAQERQIKDLVVVQEPNKTKKSPRNKVLFSEPVVTQQYEYEQTLLEQSFPPNNNHQAQQVVDCERIVIARRNFSRRKFKPVDAFDCFDDIKIHGIAAINIEDDDEDELYTMASSDLDEDAVLKETRGVAKKRPLNSIQDQNENVASCGEQARESKHHETPSFHSETGGLFSSPKVAKIAPFCHSQTDLKNSQAQNVNPNSTRSQRISLHRLALLSGSSKKSVPELLSVRDIGNESRDQVPSEADKSEPSNSGSYFGWLSNGLGFLSKMKIF